MTEALHYIVDDNGDVLPPDDDHDVASARLERERALTEDEHEARLEAAADYAERPGEVSLARHTLKVVETAQDDDEGEERERDWRERQFKD